MASESATSTGTFPANANADDIKRLLEVLTLQQQVASLERTRTRRTVILKNLPAPIYKKEIDTNLRALTRAAGYDESHIADAVNHLDHSGSFTVAFVTFTTEVVHTAVKAMLKRGFWWKRADGGNDIRVKMKDAMSSQVELHHTLELEAGSHIIKANKQQLQIFYCNAGDYPEPKLIAQLVFMPTDHSYRACILDLDMYDAVPHNSDLSTPSDVHIYHYYGPSRSANNKGNSMEALTLKLLDTCNFPLIYFSAYVATNLTYYGNPACHHCKPVN